MYRRNPPSHNAQTPQSFSVDAPLIGDAPSGADYDLWWGLSILFWLFTVAAFIIAIIALVRDPNSDSILSECLTQVFFGNGTVLGNSCGLSTAGPSVFNDDLTVFGQFVVHNTSSFGDDVVVNGELCTNGDGKYTGNLTVGGIGTILLDEPSALAVCDQCPVPSDEIVSEICNNTACGIEFEQIHFTNDSIEEFCQACNVSVIIEATDELAEEICNSTDCIIFSDRIIFINETVQSICDECNSQLPPPLAILELCASPFCLINSTQILLDDSTVVEICEQCTEFVPSNSTISEICGSEDNCMIQSSQLNVTDEFIFDICNSTSCFVDSTQVIFQPETVDSICTVCALAPQVIDNTTKADVCDFCHNAPVTIIGTLDVTDGDVTFNEDLTVCGDLLVKGNASFIGQFVSLVSNLNVIGDISVIGETFLLGSLVSTGDGNFSRVITSGEIQVGGDVTLVAGSNLIVEAGVFSIVGDIFQTLGNLNTFFIEATLGINTTVGNFAGTVQIGDDLTILDDLFVFDDAEIGDELLVIGKAQFLDDLIILGSLTVSIINIETINVTNAAVQNLTSEQLTTLNGVLTVNAESTFNANVTVTESVSIEKNLVVCGDLLVKGDIVANQSLDVIENLDVCGNVTMKGDVTVEQELEVLGELFVEGNMSLESGLAVGGSAFFNQSVSIIEDLEVCGTETVKGNVSIEQNLEVCGDTLFKGGVFINQTLVVSGGNVTMEQDLEVCGNTLFKGNVTVNQTLFNDFISPINTPWVTVGGILQSAFSFQVPFDPVFLPVTPTVKFGLPAGPVTTVIFDVTTVCITASACLPSDKRLKKNIKSVNTSDSLEKINNLLVREYQYIEQYENFVNIPHGKRETGFIAQEVEKQIPEAIGHKEEFTLGDGFHIENLRTIDKDQIFTHLVAAVQELSTIVKTQQLLIDSLLLKIK